MIHRPATPIRCLVLSALLALAGCGGGGSSLGGGGTAGGAGGGTGGGTGSGDPVWTAGVYPTPSSLAAHCAAPRSGVDPITGQAYPDVAGSIVWENSWIRAWEHAYYLWYAELPDLNPTGYTTTAAYFSADKTTAITASGSPKDKFHFTYTTSQWESLENSGVSVDYGAHWVLVSPKAPRQLLVGYVDANSPASAASLARGASVIKIDGIDVIHATDQASVDAINAALAPSKPGETHVFTVIDTPGAASRDLSLSATTVTSLSVMNVGTLTTAVGKVGYLQFNDHLSTAEKGLIDAITQLQGAGITDLVLDMRYNGGGLLDIASEAAFMIAGASRTQGKIFEKETFNDKYPTTDPITGQSITATLFHSVTQGFSVAAGQPLPSLGLTRVFILTGSDTCSASESVINSLRGIGIDVIAIGGQTCGKPYGFYPQDNCGTTYFSIEFKGVNDVGFGDYADGFIPQNAPSLNGGVAIPGCDVPDDFAHALGDPAEGRLAAALGYIANGASACPAPVATGAMTPIARREAHMIKPEPLMNRILRPRP